MSRMRKLIFGHSRSIHAPRPAIRNQVFIVLRIWRNYSHHDFGVERLIRLFLACSQFLSLSLYLKHLFGRWGERSRKLSTEVYVLGKLVFPLFVVHEDLQANPWLIAVVVYFLLETVIYIAGLIFLADVTYESVAPKRSLTLLFMNFFEIVFDFAVLYAYLSSTDPVAFNQNITAGRFAIYYSFVTAATVGYGDIIPLSTLARELAIVQITLTFVFVGLFLNYFANMLQRVTTIDTRTTSRKTPHTKKRRTSR